MRPTDNCLTKAYAYIPRCALSFDKAFCNEDSLDHTSDGDSPTIQEVWHTYPGQLGAVVSTCCDLYTLQ